MAKKIQSLRHSEAKRVNIPTAEFETLIEEQEKSPVRVAYERRNRDLDPQLVWSGKDEQDLHDLVVDAPPIFIHEKIHPQAVIEGLRRYGRELGGDASDPMPDLFADFNGIEDAEAKIEFYRHEANWTNRMILGDSLRVMASLAEREGLRGKVQCIYMDPPYGIRFNSNFQWSTTTRDVKDGDLSQLTREPEQIKAFRDTWRNGIHSYLSYLRDRLMVARDLLHESGSIFVQIGDENVHLVRLLLDEVFGIDNFVSVIGFAKTSGFSSQLIPNVMDYILWYAKKRDSIKFRPLVEQKEISGAGSSKYKPARSIVSACYTALADLDIYATSADLTSQGETRTVEQSVVVFGAVFAPGKNLHWKTSPDGVVRLAKAGRILHEGTKLRFLRLFTDSPGQMMSNVWTDIGGVQSRSDPKVYVVQTATEAIKRCILMASDPGDLVLDPTCGSGTTAYVAEQWGRRWITVDTSRVALALARARLMGARFPWYILRDAPEGQRKFAEITGKPPEDRPTHGRVSMGFVCETVPRITLRSIARNAEIDVIWEKWQPEVEAALTELNAALRGHPVPFEVRNGGRRGTRVDFTAPDDARHTLPCGDEVPGRALLEWEVPRDFPRDWPEKARGPFERFWEARIARQKEIDTSIERNAERIELVDRPYEDPSRIRVTGPFTVESLSPVRSAVAREDGEFELAGLQEAGPGHRYQGEVEPRDFAQFVLEQLRTAGVAQHHKEDRIRFDTLEPWPGELVCAEGRYTEGETARRAAIMIGPEYGTVSRADLVEAAREAAEAGFDVLIACAFAFEAQAADLQRVGKIPVLKAHLNPELHLGELKTEKTSAIAVVFGEPDVEIEELEDGRIRVRIKGVDIFDPRSGQVRSHDPKDIACWFVDTDYDGESFFVRQAYFPGMLADPFKALSETLKGEIDKEAWECLRRTESLPFPRPSTGRIAVKVINHLGDEAMRVFRV